MSFYYQALTYATGKTALELTPLNNCPLQQTAPGFDMALQFIIWLNGLGHTLNQIVILQKLGGF